MSGFSIEWEDIYLNGEQLTSWPWSDVISLMHRYCKDVVSKKSVVFELGCGVGPNIPFIQSLGMNYYGVDGSSTAIENLHQKFPKLINQTSVGDFTNIECYSRIPGVDIAIDRAAITHNNLNAIKQILENIYNVLKSGGYFVGIDWFSTKHFSSKMGSKSVDENTRVNIDSGQFKNVGNVHFSDEEELRKLFSNFDIIVLEEKVINSFVSQNNNQFASWNIVARKK
jgi:SAM-dependent methyltransferase